MNIKHKIATAILIMVTGLGLQAQDKTEKYDYAIMQYKFNAGDSIDGIWVNLPGKEFERVKKIDSKSLHSKGAAYDFGPVVDYLKIMTDAGWEVVSTDMAVGRYLLRKKQGK